MAADKVCGVSGWGPSGLGGRGLVPRADPVERERRIAGWLFAATCGSVFLVYLLRWQVSPWSSGIAVVGRSIAFTVTLMAILLAHEAGHWLTARRGGLRLSLPWFLPAPILVGTFGAVIRLEGQPRDRTSLLEMGASGPLAGLGAIALVMFVRLASGVPDVPSDGTLLSTPLLWWALSWLLTGAPPEAISTQDPLGFAAWIGCLLTAINLIPFGQLDGGHVLHALAPTHSRRVGWALTLLLLLGGFVWPGWAIWIATLHLLGTRAPVEVRDTESPPTDRARWMAGVCVAAFGLSFTVVPL